MALRSRPAILLLVQPEGAKSPQRMVPDIKSTVEPDGPMSIAETRSLLLVAFETLNVRLAGVVGDVIGAVTVMVLPL